MSTLLLIAIIIILGALILAVGPIAVTRLRRRPDRPRPRPPAPGRPPAPVTTTPRPDSPSPAVDVEAQAPAVQAPDVEAQAPAVEAPAVEAPAPAVEAPAEDVLQPSVKPRLRDRLGKARALLGSYVSSILARTTIDGATWDELEEALVRADVGVGLATALLDDLRSRVKSEAITTPDQLLASLRADLEHRLSMGDRVLHVDGARTNVWLFVGVNGVGKTTTIGKIGHRERAAGHSVVMAAGDTFRAAAGDQLELWAQRAGADLVRGAEGGDPASVIFDAIARAGARGADLVLADTAGRLHTKVNLMEELKKVRRVAERPPGHVSEVLLVIDATTGQNGLVQAKEFAQAVGVTGVVLTKLDGTAKGGIAVAIATELGIPIKLVGIGESVDDLIQFDPAEFVDALLGP